MPKGDPSAPHIGCAGTIFRSGNSTSGSVARGVLRVGTSAAGARGGIAEIHSSYI